MSHTIGNQDAASDAEDDDPDDKPEPVKILQSAVTFKEVTVWGHDMLPALDDPFVKGIGEWIAFAEAIHRQPSEPELPICATDRGDLSDLQ